VTTAAPVLIAVDDDPEARKRIRAELSRRYSADYRVACANSAEAAMHELRRAREAGSDVALVLADHWLGATTGSELLSHVRGLHPHAKRALLIDWGAWGHRPTAEAILEAMALGRIDYYVLKPSRPGDEYFHRTITEFLHEWTREHSGAHGLVVVADPKTPRAHEICDLLRRSGIPFSFQHSDSAAARELLAANPDEEPPGPILRLYDGTVLSDPTNEEIAAAYGVDTEPPEEADSDVIIVGAGPAGLSAAVYASSEGLRTLVLERHAVGGQAGSSSLIRNYLGFSRGVSGGELSQRAYQQAWTFGARFAITREAIALDVGDRRHGVSCDAGFTGTAGAVVLATGVSYRRLGIPALDDLVGAGVFYGASTAGFPGLGDERVYVLGGGNSAGQAALHLARSHGRVTVLVRGPSLSAGMSQYLQEAIAAAPNIEVQTRSEVTGGGGNGRLEWLELRYAITGESRRVAAAALFILIGARPRTDWLPKAIARDGGGYVLTGADVLADQSGSEVWPLERMPMSFETSVPGVFAVGDVRHGSTNRVASAVGEGSVVVPQVHEWLAQGESGARAATIAAQGTGHAR
jgi:thioredoxin reductase (NADPH)